MYGGVDELGELARHGRSVMKGIDVQRFGKALLHVGSPNKGLAERRSDTGFAHYWIAELGIDMAAQSVWVKEVVF